MRRRRWSSSRTKEILGANNARLVHSQCERVIKGNHDHISTLGHVHVDEFHNRGSDTAPTPKLISDYKNEQSVTDDPDNIKGKHESTEKHRVRMKTQYKEKLSYVYGYSATPWSKLFTNMAAIVGAIEQP